MTAAETPEPAAPPGEASRPVRPASAPLVIGLGIVFLLGFAALALSVLGNLPDRRRLLTPEVGSSPPPFAAEVEAQVAAADTARGEALFARYDCAACHHARDDGAGPPRPGMGERAAARREGYNAAAYLYESITDPNAYVVPGYPPSVMVQNFKTAIPEADLYILVAWLLEQ